MSPEDQGRWELDLWSGSAWFSGWFRERLQWPAESNRRKLDALRPYLAPGAWEALLGAIRAHLERQVPLDLELHVLLPGRIQRWQVTGSADRSPAGRPMTLSGTMHDLGTAQPPDPPAAGETP